MSTVKETEEDSTTGKGTNAPKSYDSFSSRIKSTSSLSLNVQVSHGTD